MKLCHHTVHANSTIVVVLIVICMINTGSLGVLDPCVSLLYYNKRKLDEIV